MSRYTLTASAEADILDILQFIASRDGADRALHVYDKLIAAFETLAASPAIGTRKPHLTDSAVRWWPVFRLLVVYDAERSPIDILRVIHSARDLPAMFEK